MGGHLGKRGPHGGVMEGAPGLGADALPLLGVGSKKPQGGQEGGRYLPIRTFFPIAFKFIWKEAS